MYTPKYFELNELITSATAMEKGFKQNPSPEEVNNLYNLCRHLDILRQRYGRAILINSGYRSEDLNNYLKGSRTSWHLKGRAVDMKCADLAKLKKVVCEYIGIPLDLSNGKKNCKPFEVIFYPTFIHFAERP